MWLGTLFYFILIILQTYFIMFYLRILNFSFFYKFISKNIIKNSILVVFIYVFISLVSFLYSVFEVNNLFKLFFVADLTFLSIYVFPFIFIFLFITFLSILFCLMYNLNEIFLFFFYCSFILFIGFNLFLTDYLIYFFLLYEMLLIPSFFILYKFAKTRRAVEAAYLMFFWTQFGAIFLIFSFIYLFFITKSSLFSELYLFSFSRFDINFLFICFFIGFGVKLPIWPFYGWLPKAHVEASTNFSIFLSGVLVKFAFFGFVKCLVLISLEPTFLYIIPVLLIGLIDSSFKLFYQIDLKKIVAYSTVIEMHWLTLCVISGYSYLFLAGFCMLVSHAFLSTNFFLLVDCINRRFKTRLITEISSIGLFNTKLFILVLINLLIFLGFPGSLFFIAEVLFFSFILDFLPTLSIILLVILYLIVPTIFFKLWWLPLCGNSINLKNSYKVDLDSKEILLIGSISAILFWLGVTWQIFLF